MAACPVSPPLFINTISVSYATLYTHTQSLEQLMLLYGVCVPSFALFRVTFANLGVNNKTKWRS